MERRFSKLILDGVTLGYILSKYFAHEKTTKTKSLSRFFNMPATGIEPVREYKSRRILSPVRLPVPPRRLVMST